MTDLIQDFINRKLEQLGKNGINRDMFTLIRMVQIYGDCSTEEQLCKADKLAEELLK